jgi:hypothetical protein
MTLKLCDVIIDVTLNTSHQRSQRCYKTDINRGTILKNICQRHGFESEL